VLRTQDCVPRLREGRVFQATHQVLGRYVGLDEFRIVHASIQGNHFHLLVEALDRQALSAGMQSLTINLARGINGALGSYGKVFAHRFHETTITTARQARNALAYVLNNWRKHREDLASPRAMAAKLDPCGVVARGGCPYRSSASHASRTTSRPGSSSPSASSPESRNGAPLRGVSAVSCVDRRDPQTGGTRRLSTQVISDAPCSARTSRCADQTRSARPHRSFDWGTNGVRCRDRRDRTSEIEGSAAMRCLPRPAAHRGHDRR